MTAASPNAGMFPYTVSTVASLSMIVSWKIPTEPLSRTFRLNERHAGRCCAAWDFEYASNCSNEAQYCHTRTVRPDR
ncbi:unannotated protein [freshwater metagenome]|uniref:Unannotated protein n=1 Tax=freshwater metagenome TaxID=449393 RepID=A0A6J7EZN7_9ZZZZ